MKKLTLLSCLLIIGLLVLSGCGKKPANEPGGEPHFSTEREKEGGSLETGDGFGFNDFTLTIQDDKQEVVYIDYKIAKNVVAKFKNAQENLDLVDAEAMNEIGEYFTYTLFTKDLVEEDIITKTLQYFDVESYSTFDLKLIFDDGTKLNIQDEQ